MEKNYKDDTNRDPENVDIQIIQPKYAQIFFITAYLVDKNNRDR